MSEGRVDILGNALSDTEQEVLDIHLRLQALISREGLPPCVEANARHALAATWQIVTDLDLTYSPLEDG